MSVIVESGVMMSGKIKLKVRKGKSLDWRYTYYPEAYIDVTGECGNIVSLSPSYKNIMDLILAFRKHELKVDRTRYRKTYTSKLIGYVKEILSQLKQIKLNEYEHIEQIYTEQEVMQR